MCQLCKSVYDVNMKNILLFVLIAISLSITFILYQYIAYKEVLLPWFAYYSRCLDNTCVLNKQARNIREVYDTYCCDTEKIVSCGNDNSRLASENDKVCNYVCIGKHYKKGGVRTTSAYCN